MAQLPVIKAEIMPHNAPRGNEQLFEMFICEPSENCTETKVSSGMEYAELNRKTQHKGLQLRQDL